MTRPWDRRPNESDKAWIAFVHYRDTPPGQRSLSNVAKAFGNTSGKERVVQGWSSKHEWVVRVRAFDAHLDQRSGQPAVEKARAEMADRHARLGKALQGIAATALPHLKVKAEAGKLKAGEVAALTKAGVDTERVAAGEPTEIQRVALVDDGRERLRRLFGDEEASA